MTKDQFVKSYGPNTGNDLWKESGEAEADEGQKEKPAEPGRRSATPDVDVPAQGSCRQGTAAEAVRTGVGSAAPAATAIGERDVDGELPAKKDQLEWT
eukprot:gene19931-46492_t